MIDKFILGLILGFMTALSPQLALAQTGAHDATMVNGYVLGPGDVIEVSVLGQDEFKPRVQVLTDGTIQLPFIGSVTAAEKTVLQLRNEVSSALKAGGYYADPAVNIAVVGYASRYVVVLGEVGTPGIVAIDRAYRVSEILARVGGVRDTAADQVSLRRDSGEETLLDLRTISIGGPDEDPLVGDGDKLFVDKAETFYIYGQVNGPGTYKISRGMTVRMALARGGGLTPIGTEKRVKIIRGDATLEKVDLSEPLRGDDVVVVGERFF